MMTTFMVHDEGAQHLRHEQHAEREVVDGFGQFVIHKKDYSELLRANIQKFNEEHNKPMGKF